MQYKWLVLAVTTIAVLMGGNRLENHFHRTSEVAVTIERARIGRRTKETRIKMRANKQAVAAVP